MGEKEELVLGQMLDSLLKNTPDSIYFKDTELRFVKVNDAKARNSNTTPEDMVGKTDFDFMPTQEAELSRLDDLKVMETGQPVTDRIEKLTRPDDIVAWVSVTKLPWIDERGSTIGVIGISRNITRRKRVEESILSMLSIATHDMRDPIASIGSTIKLLMRGFFGPIDKSIANTLSDLYRRVVRVESIIDEYLCKSNVLDNIELPKKEYLDLRQDIIDPVLEALSAEILENNIFIDNSLGSIPAGLIKVHGNRLGLKIIYRVLISNAIKYGGYGCTIAFGAERSGILKLNVFNNGPPVPASEQGDLFKKFSRGSTSENISGIGIGLYTIKKLIERHGGSIWYETTESGHPNFIFTMPNE